MIGIWGNTSGCGVTHFTIAVAMYLSLLRKQKTAVLERNGSNQIECFRKDQDSAIPFMHVEDIKPIWRSGIKKSVESHSYFKYRQVTYFPNVCKSEMTSILQMKYQDILIDFGSKGEYVPEEFLFCDIRIVILDASPWKEMKLNQWFLKQTDQELKKNTYVMLCHDQKLVSKYHREYGVSCYQMPFQPDAFCLNPLMIQLLEQLISP